MTPPFIPYGRQQIDDDDVRAVVEALKSDWLTTGPAVERFERLLAGAAGATHAVAVSSGTAALHAAAFALGIGPGDEVIVPAMTFAASANCVVYQGGTPVFCDVLPGTLCIDPDAAARKITPRTKALVVVDFAGQPCDYGRLRPLAQERNLALVADACHALGAEYGGRRAGSLGDLSAFSFHPVKQITTGEGGAITTDNAGLAARMRSFRNHGIDADQRQRQAEGTWLYAMTALGWNYRLTDFQCALGASQLAKLPARLARRREIARRYDAAFADEPAVKPLEVAPGLRHAYHLYVVRVDPAGAGADRAEFFAALRARGIGVNVHYIPVHLHPYYRQRFRTGPGLCPVAEAAYERILSLPIHPGMRDADVERVIAAVRGAREGFAARRGD